MTNLPGGTDRDVLMLAVLGSTAYGLAHADSDLDRVGVYAAPTSEVLGLRGGTVTDQSVVTHEPDLTLHEVGKFCRLALKGNPTVSELLWASSYDVLDSAGARLVEARDAFLSTPAVRASYGGYAMAQSRKVAAGRVAGQRVEKAARHAMRLLLQGTQLLAHGRIVLNVGSQREFLFEMGELAQTNREQFLTRFDAARAAFDTMDSVLPEKPDTQRVERLLVDLRRER